MMSQHRNHDHREAIGNNQRNGFATTSWRTILLWFLLFVIVSIQPLNIPALEEEEPEQQVAEQEQKLSEQQLQQQEQPQQEEQELYEEFFTEHAQLRQQTLINLHQDDSSQDPLFSAPLDQMNASTAAQEVIHRISQNVSDTIVIFYNCDVILISKIVPYLIYSWNND